MKKMLTLSLAALSLLQGCSVMSKDELQSMDSLMYSGRCAEAYEIANRTSNAIRYYNSGVIASRCEYNDEKAFGFFTYGARNGEKNSINMLLQNGRPVPQEDQARQSSSGDAALGIMLLQAAQPRPATVIRQPSTSCVTRYMNGAAFTDCN